MEQYFYFMDILKNKKLKKSVKYTVIASIAIPMFYIIYQTIILGKENVVLYVNSTLYSVLLLTYYGLVFILIVSWGLKEIRQILKLKNEKIKNELQHLKAQVSPHFLFNMLNNVYGLIEKDTPKAKKLVLELSEMMRYSIYKSQHDSVMLKEEILFIQNYLNLHKMRYRKIMDINFSLEVENDEVQIMPLLFINLVENAFKHGVENLMDNAYVYINLVSKNNQIYFEVENNFDTELVNEEKGIGLQNLTRRLDLAYPNQYSLTSTSINNVFNIQLKLALA